MKTKFFLILALILVFAVVACTKSDDAPDESPETSSTFRATVLEVYEKSLLVEAEEGSWERGSGGEISVST